MKHREIRGLAILALVYTVTTNQFPPWLFILLAFPVGLAASAIVDWVDKWVGDADDTDQD